MTVCPRCGQNGDEIVLLGIHNRMYECAASSCKARTIGRKEKTCPGCGCEVDRVFVREIREHERVSGSVCGACQKELKEHQEVVEAGGIVFRCKDCGAKGVIKESAPLAKKVREQLKVDPPKPCGVEFDKATCPACGPIEGWKEEK